MKIRRHKICTDHFQRRNHPPIDTLHRIQKVFTIREEKTLIS